MTLFRFSVPVILAFVATACMVGPPPPRPIEGLRVRATISCPATTVCAGYSHGESHEGTLILVDSDTLVLYAKDRRARVGLPVVYIDKLEVYRGREGSAAAAAKGAAVGAIGGAVLGAVIGGATEALVGHLDGERDVGEAAGVWAAEGAVVGAIGGAVAGATSGETVWEEVTVEQLREELCHCRLPQPAAADSIVTALLPGSSHTCASS